MDQESLLLQLIKDVAKLQEGFNAFQKERKDDNSGMQNDIKEVKASIKDINNKLDKAVTKEELDALSSRVSLLEAEPGKRARSRQDKVLEYVLTGILSVIGTVILAILFAMLRKGVPV